jgi:hypothetical protein
MAGPAASPVVRDGRPAALRFDGRLTWVWWGEDADGLDVVAAAGRRVLTFATEEACRAAFPSEPLAAVAGPVLLLGPDHLRTPGPVTMVESVPGPGVTDLGAAQEWAAGRSLLVPAESALDLWNWGVDIARSTGRPFMHRGQVRDACYGKLVAAQVPWMFDRDGHRPAWQPAQLTALRGTLNDAINLIRAALRT